MKRYLLPLIMLISLLVFSTVAGAYEPLPGVPHPDEVDFGGETVTVTGMDYPFEDFEEDGDYPGRLEQAKELFNVEFDFIEIEYGEMVDLHMARLMAGDSEYDLWGMGSDAMVQLIAEGALAAADWYLPDEYFAALPDQPRQISYHTTFQDEIYSWEPDRQFIGNARMIFWNKDLFEREGLPDLYELYENDQWTFEKFTEIAVEATRDTSGDDEIDQWGTSTPWIPEWIYANDGRLTREEEGEVKFALTEEQSLEALEYLHVWDTVEEVIREHGWDMGDLFAEGNVAMVPHELWKGPWGAMADMEDEFGIVPLPRGPHADGYVAPLIDCPVGYGLPLNSANPEGKIALINFLWRPEEVAEEQEQFIQDLAADRTSHEIITKKAAEWSGEFAFYETFLDNYYDAVFQVLGGEESAAVAMNAIESEMQSRLDEHFE